MSGRKIVLLDLDDTILDFGTAERKALSGALEELGIPADEALLRRYSEINRFCWQQLERGEMTRGELLVGRFERLFREKGIACPPELAQEKYEERLAMGCGMITICILSPTETCTSRRAALRAQASRRISKAFSSPSRSEPTSPRARSTTAALRRSPAFAARTP